MTEPIISDNIAKLLERVRLAAQKSQRDKATVKVLAVSKTRPSEAIRRAHECGLSDFGENYLQEALEKVEELSDLELNWHFIGPIQSNKTKLIAENFDWVHSIDRAKVARRLSEQRPTHLPPLQTCIQVNISREYSKSGVSLEELPFLAKELRRLPGITLRGLMAIPAETDDFEYQSGEFGRLRTAMENLKDIVPEMDTLSMGMSQDMEAAITEGSTMVRIGTAIFGPRNK
ncbi:MAG: YggS family pyridoxal phosphate-dependent enzyme [Halioglobus sp.]